MGRRKACLVFGICVFLLFVTVFGVMLNVPLVRSTNVGGIIKENTTWTRENSPYIITKTVQIPWNVTLTIEPGVIVDGSTSTDRTRFLLHGTIRAQGTPENRIVFRGAGQAILFEAEGYYYDSTLILDYAIIESGYLWLTQPAHFNLTNSELKHIGSFELNDPKNDVWIEYNKFTSGIGGLTILQSHGKVYIRYNVFQLNRPISVWNAYGQPGVVVKHNSFFINPDSPIVLETKPNVMTEEINATENHWGTTNTEVIDSMIYDANDDIRLDAYIEYSPILTDPHSATLALDVDAPITTQDYDALWHNTDFIITLTATDDLFGVSETYYKINDGPTKNISTHGQPHITTESSNNTLEYWSVDNAGNEELPHKLLTEIKLGKTTPTGFTEAFPIWILGAAVALIGIGVAVATFLIRRIKTLKEEKPNAMRARGSDACSKLF